MCHCVVLNIQWCNVPCGLFKFLKRQDLLNVLARMMRPACDQVVCISQIAIEISPCGVGEVEHKTQIHCVVLLKVVSQSQSLSVCL